MPIATLEDDISRLIPTIQDLFVRILEACECDGDAGVSRISDQLGVHRKLAWQVRNVAYTNDPFQAVRFMPTATGVDTLVTALRDRDVAGEVEASLRRAVAAFDELVEIHAGDRASMEMLVSACATQADEQTELKWREKAFLGASFIWGVQTRTQLSVSVARISDEDPGMFDYVQVRGLIGLKRVRPKVKWLVGQSVILDGSAPGRERERVPLDPEAAEAMGGVPIIANLCSQPLPEVRRRPTEQGFLNDVLTPAPVGFAGQQTIVTGEIIRKLGPIQATPENRRALFGSVVRTPSEVFLHDHFVHRDLFPNAERELCVFGELHSPVTQDDEDLLPVPERIETLGRGLTVARTPDVPGYMEMLKSIFDRIGWDPTEFDVYRVRMAYPPMPASVMIRHKLPELTPAAGST